MKIFPVILLVIAVGLLGGLVYVLYQKPTVRQDVKTLGRDAGQGVQDSYDATKDAVRSGAEATKDATQDIKEKVNDATK